MRLTSSQTGWGKTQVYLLFFLLLAVSELGAQNASIIESAYKAFFTDKDWDKSIELFSLLREQNPTHADYTVRLAFALQYAGKFKESIQAFQDAKAIGPWPDIYYYQMAVCYARLGDQPNTLKHLQLSLQHGWPRYLDLENDKNFASLKGTEAFDALFGRSHAEPVSREKRWQADLDFLLSRLQLLHYDRYHKTPQKVWDIEVAAVRKKIKTSPDHQIIVSLMKLAALAGEGHTKVLPPENGTNAFHAIPIVLYHFSNGCYIVKAAPPYQKLIGHKVLQIGSRKLSDLVSESEKYAGHENQMHHKKINPRFLVMSETLFDMHAIDRLNEVEIVTADPNGQTYTNSIKTKTLKEIKTEESNWPDLAPATDQPLYLRNKQQDWWYTSIPERQTFYINIRYIVNQNGLSFSRFIDSTFMMLDQAGAKKLVLDLRNCGGGNSTLNRFLINAILKRPELTQQGNLFTIIGRNTYFAAQNLVADIEYRLNSTLIGEPTGSSPNFIGESNALKLPYSQLYFVVSNRYHQGGANNSLDKRPWVSPDILIELTSEEYARNVDPVMEYFLSDRNP